MYVCPPLLSHEEAEVSGEKVAEMIIVGSKYQHSAARQLRLVARDKIRQRREITEDLAFLERLSALWKPKHAKVGKNYFL